MTSSEPQPKGDLAKAAARALRRAAKRAREVARRYGARIHVETNGVVTALKP